MVKATDLGLEVYADPISVELLLVPFSFVIVG